MVKAEKDYEVRQEIGHEINIGEGDKTALQVEEMKSRHGEMQTTMHPAKILKRQILPQTQEQARKKLDNCQQDEWIIDALAIMSSDDLAL